MSFAYFTAVQKIYIAFYQRPADPAGLRYWAQRMEAAGGDQAAVIDAFANSAEATALYGAINSTTIGAVVDALYLALFNRAPDADGKKFYVDAFNAGTITAGKIALAVLNGATGDDAVAVQNKVTVANEFTQQVDGRELNDAGFGTGTAFNVTYTGNADTVAARDFLKAVTSSPATVLNDSQITEALKTKIADATDPIQGQSGGKTFTLTTGADQGASFVGTSGNDTFVAAQVAAGNTWTVGDQIDGGAGTDVFNVTQTAAITMPVSATVKNVETANLTSGTTANVIDTTTWTGLTALNVTGVTAQTVTAAATTDVAVTGSTATGATTVNGGKNVTVTETGASGGTVGIGATTAAAGTVTVNSTILATAGSTGNAITVTGGTAVSVTQKGANAVSTTVTDGAVIVNGNASTTTVTVTADKAATAAATVVGHVNGAVTVTDVNAASATAAGTIATVTLNNFAAATIDSSAISTVNLTGTATSLGIGRGALTATPTANTLAVNVNGLTMTGALTDSEAAADDGFTTVNIASSTAASSVGSMAFADATTLNISGDAKFTSGGETLTAVTAINVTNTAGATLATALGTGVLFTGGAGADSVSLGATTKAITMGAGDDTVIYGGAAGTGGSVNAGDGSDTIQMSGAEADAADLNSTFNSTFTNFEVLSIETGATETLDVVGLNNVSKVKTIGANGLTVNNLASGGTLTLTGASTAATMGVRDAAFNAADTFNIALSNSTAGVVAFGSVTVANVETVNISTVDAGTSTSTAATIDTATLAATSAKSIVVSGNNGLTLTNTGNVAVTSFDASGVVANGTDDTAANLAVTFTSANTTASASITIKGGAGNDVLAGNATTANANNITGGEGADQITTGLGNDTFVLTETTAAADTVVFATTANNGIDTITGFQAGAGATTDKAKLVAAATTNAAQDVAGVADFAAISVALTSGAQAYVLGASTATNDIIEITTALSSFGNLGAAGVVDGTELLKALSSTNVAASSFTTSTAGDDFYLVAYQNGNAYLYQVTDAGLDTTVVAADIALVGVFNGVAAGAFAAGDFTV